MNGPLRKREDLRLLRGLALATAVGAWVVIVIGGYVTATNAGLACPNLVDCGPAPLGPQAATELTHRLAAWVEGFLVLALFVLVVWRYRAWEPVRNLTVLAFLLVVAQSGIGMLSVAVGYDAFGMVEAYPVLVTAHLGVATAFLAVTVLNAAIVIRGAPPSPVTIVAAKEHSSDAT